MERLVLTIEGMSCAHCIQAVSERLSATPGIVVEHVELGSATIQRDPARISMDDIMEAVADEGYTVA